MTFLQLVQRLHREAGGQAVEPTTVLSQIGMAKRFVDWIQTAYGYIQSLHETWLFRQKDFSFSTVATSQNYTPLGLGISDFGLWKYNYDGLSGITIYLTEADEQYLQYVPWEEFRANYKFGASRTATGRPTFFTVKPDFSIELWPIPNSIFTITGEYIICTHVLSLNADTPIFTDYHMAIVWQALKYYGAEESAPDVYAHGDNEYNKLISQIEFKYLEKMTYGNSLV